MTAKFHITPEIVEDFRRRAKEREAVALPLAAAVLRGIEAKGFEAWVVGSLAKKSFTVHSDVDFVVDCPKEREHDVFMSVARTMGHFPFDLVFCRWIDDDVRPFMMEAATNASELGSGRTTTKELA
jgi:predicted nucleotidyltransferase